MGSRSWLGAPLPSPSLDSDFPDLSDPCPLWPLPFLTYTLWPLTSTLPKLCPPWLLPSALLTPDLSDFCLLCTLTSLTLPLPNLCLPWLLPSPLPCLCPPWPFPSLTLALWAPTCPDL